MLQSDAFEVAIPSYRRAERCRDSTLAVLAEHNINPARITVFVADEEERQRYEGVLLPGSYGRLVVGKGGMATIRNIMQRHYRQGARVLSVDDDVYGVFQKVNDKLLQPIHNLKAFVSEAFEVTVNAGATLWGVYPALNPMFMKHTVTTDLRHIVGCFYGWIAQPDNRALCITTDYKTDYELSILHYLQDGKVMRFNYIAPKTKYYKEPGGMQVDRTVERTKNSALYLCKRYPQFCTLNLTKKSGWYEIRMRDQRVVA